MLEKINAHLARFNIGPITGYKITLWGVALVVLHLLFLKGLFGAVSPGSPTLMPYVSDFASTNSGMPGFAPSSEGSFSGSSKGVAQISARNVASSMQAPAGTSVPGSTAENLEVTSYSASIETRHLDDTCEAVTALKVHEYVVFENANSYEKNCSFNFKVEKAHVDEVLVQIKALDPKTLSQNTYTIEQQISDFTSREESLKRKLASIDDTMKSSLTAYDDITRLATQSRDAGSLASIISSKISLIQQLTQERINVTDELDMLSRAKAKQLDGVSYTTFRVDVTERLYIDGSTIADSWRDAMRTFVQNVNKLVQDLTINLVALVLQLLLYVTYFFIVLVVVKYVIKFGKALWNY